MADPLSFVASIIAVSTLAGTVVTKGYKYLEAAATRDPEVKQLIAGLTVLSGVLNQLEQLITREDSRASEESHSPRTKHDEAHDVTRDGNTASQLSAPPFITECLRTLAEISNVLDKFNDKAAQSYPADHERKVWSVKRLRKLSTKDLKWPLARSATFELLARLERHKSTCSLALQEYETLKIHAVLDQTQYNSRSLGQLVAGQQRMIELQTTEEHEQTLRWFTGVNPAQKHQAFSKERCDGTGLWLFDLAEVIDWIEAPKSALWIYGIPGAGKTIISTLVVDMILNPRRSPTVGTAYFYVRYDDHQSQISSEILGSLLSQLARQNNDAMQILVNLYNHYKRKYLHEFPPQPSEMELADALREVSASFESTYILIDGLDECKNEFDLDRAKLLQLLSELPQSLESNSHTIIFSRHVPDIAKALQDFEHLSIAAVNADLRLYVSRWLPDLELQSRELAAEIMDTLIFKAEGMFVWVRAQLDLLRRLPSDAEKKDALQHLPKSLYATYIRIFENIDACYPPQTRARICRTLKWLVRGNRTDRTYCVGNCIPNGARAPQNFTALMQAIDVELTSHWSPELPSVTKQSLLRWLGCLVRVDTVLDVEVLSLAHFTVQEFLELNPESVPSEIARNYMVNALDEHYLNDVCLTYIAHDTFRNLPLSKGSKAPIDQFQKDFPFYKSAVYGAVLAMDYKLDDYSSSRFTKSLLDYPEHQNYRLFRQVLTQLTIAQSGSLAVFSSALSLACFVAAYEDVKRLLEQGAFADHISSPLIQYTLFGGLFTPHEGECWMLDANFHLILPRRENDSEGSEDQPIYQRYKQALTRQQTVQLLLDHGADLEATVEVEIRYDSDLDLSLNPFRVCGLCSSLIIGDPITSTILLQHGASPHFLRSEAAASTTCGFGKFFEKNATRCSGIVATIEACQDEKLRFSWDRWKRGHSGTTEDRAQPLSDNQNRTLSQEAFVDLYTAGHWPQALDRLKFAENIDINALDDQGSSAIHRAASAPEEILQELLKHGSDLNLKANDGSTPLITAVMERHIGNARVLLQNGADVNQCNKDGTTALHYAAMLSQMETAYLLIEHGAAVDAFSETEYTPLWQAAVTCFIPGVYLLIDSGADTNLVTPAGHAIVHRVARLHDPQCRALKALIDAGANINIAATSRNLTPNAKSQADDLPDLLDFEAELHYPDDYAWTALDVASYAGIKNTVELLLTSGADIDHCSASGGTALHKAVRAGKSEIVSILVEAGISLNLIDSNGDTPLLLATRYASTDIVRLLVNAGSDLDATDNQGTGTIALAAEHPERGAELFYELLAAGANGLAKDNYGTSAIHVGCKQGSVEMVATLLECSGDMADCANSCSITEGTPLYQAAKEDNIRIIEMLLAAGADVDKVCEGNVLGPTIMAATANGHIDAVQCLASHGALLQHAHAKFGSVFDTARAFKQTKMLDFLGSEEFVKAQSKGRGDGWCDVKRSSTQSPDKALSHICGASATGDISGFKIYMRRAILQRDYRSLQTIVLIFALIGVYDVFWKLTQ